MGNPVPESPMEMARTIKKMLDSSPIDKIVKNTRKPKEWIENTHSLLKLHHLIQGLVDDGSVSLGNAYILAQHNLIQQLWLQKKAQEMTIAEFADYAKSIDWNTIPIGPRK